MHDDRNDVLVSLAEAKWTQAPQPRPLKVQLRVSMSEREQKIRLSPPRRRRVGMDASSFGVQLILGGFFVSTL